MAGNSDFIRGHSDLLVLSVLSEEPLYGYAIVKKVEARSNGKVTLSPGVLYPILHELEKQGLLLAEWERPAAAEDKGDETRGRPRKWYRLSAKGRRRLSQRVAAHRAWQAVVDAFLPPAADDRSGG